MQELIVENISRTYRSGTREVAALKHVSATFPKGSFTAVIGKSGSGKTTFLRILGGLEHPDSGSVKLDGEDITTYSDSELAAYRRRRTGFIFQNFRLLDDLTVLENVILPGTIDKLRPDMPYVDELLDLLEIADKRSAFPYELSGGEQQRVAIARAYAHRPDIILADEPTGNLDSQSGEFVMELFRSAHERYGQTVIMVTHDIDLARRCERVLRISDGELTSDFEKSPR